MSDLSDVLESRTIAEEQTELNGGKVRESFFGKQRLVASDSYSIKGVV